MKPLILFLSMIFSVLGCQPGQSSRNQTEGALIQYEYRRSAMRISPAEYYKVEASENGGLQLTWSKDASDGTILKVPDDALEHIDAMVLQYKLARLKENYRPIGHVLDGTMWDVHFRYEKGSISSGGDNAWPAKDLWNGVLAINDYLHTLIDAASETDVIGTIPYRDL